MDKHFDVMPHIVHAGLIEVQSLHEYKINFVHIIRTFQNTIDETTNVNIKYVQNDIRVECNNTLAENLHEINLNWTVPTFILLENGKFE